MGRKEITTLIRNLCTQDLAWRDLSIPYILVELDKVHGKSVRTPKILAYASLIEGLLFPSLPLSECESQCEWCVRFEGMCVHLKIWCTHTC